MPPTPALRRRHSLRLLAAASLALGLPAAALAQAAASAFPAKAITFIVPFAAGSATDQLARALGQSVAEQSGQPVLVENKAGASGMIAAAHVAKAPADGYTVLITTNTTHAANEHLYKKLSYDPVKDFAPITGLGKGGQVLVVRADAPYASVPALIAAAKQAPGKLSFGSGSSSSRVAGEMFKQLSGADILHVPYRSNPNALTDLLGGQIDLMITDTATGAPHIQAGKLKALGVSTAQRLPLLPEVPTIAEAGVPGYDMGYWFAAYAPAGAPAPVISQLNRLLTQASQSPAAQSFFRNSGASAWTTTPEALATFQREETQKWGRVIRAAGIQPE